jgi:hypothetical protein
MDLCVSLVLGVFVANNTPLRKEDSKIHQASLNIKPQA